MLVRLPMLQRLARRAILPQVSYRHLLPTRYGVMAEPQPSAGIHRSRLFFGICLALIPTGASFALVSNILIQLKQQFILTNYQVGLIGGAALWGMAISLLVMGPLLEAFGLKNGARLAFIGHVA